jgi:glycosyltransferase involved in cell wall biosynthesis
MKIAQVAPLFESVPPRQYGGTERVVSYVTEELVRQGHEVTLFASGDSQTTAQLVAGCPRSLWRDAGCRDTLPHHLRLVELVAHTAHRFDLIHFHLDYVHFPAIERLPCPAVTTLHGRLHPNDDRAFFDAFPRAPLVSISDAQRTPIPGASWAATVYHGLPRDLHTFRNSAGSYLAFLGRLSQEKGIEAAVEIARRAGMRLRVAAKIYPEEKPYFDQVVAPLFGSSPWVEFIGEVGGRLKDEFLGNARALVFPIGWDEPFGLVMIEAMACGTPVVAYRRGSVPEVMADGVTGFVVDGVDEAVAAVGRLGEISRWACRRAFEQRFDARRMTRDYIEVYRQLAAGGQHEASPFAEGACDRWPNHLPAGLLGPVEWGCRPEGVTT